MKIFYVKPSDSSFIKVDEDILRRNFGIITCKLNMRSVTGLFFSLLKMMILLIINFFRYRIIYTRFADYYAALLAIFARITGKKLIIVIGGIDVNFLPEFKYGFFAKRLRGLCARFALNHAHLLMPNSPALIYDENSYAADTPVKSGIRYFTPETKSLIRLVPNGFNPDFWKSIEGTEKDPVVLGVAIINDLTTFRIKGTDLFFEIAEQLKKQRFIYIGMSSSFIREQSLSIPPNVEIVGNISPHQLLNYYQKAKVFLILSLTEGMPNALCEAMLCQCIPVGSNVSMIPEIIGDSGLIIYKRDKKEIAEKVLEALNMSEQSGIKAREKVITNYSFERREKILVDLLKELYH